MRVVPSSKIVHTWRCCEGALTLTSIGSTPPRARGTTRQMTPACLTVVYAQAWQFLDQSGLSCYRHDWRPCEWSGRCALAVHWRCAWGDRAWNRCRMVTTVAGPRSSLSLRQGPSPLQFPDNLRYVIRTSVSQIVATIMAPDNTASL